MTMTPFWHSVVDRLATHRVRGMAVPWFAAEDWPRLLEASLDRHVLPATFEEFERIASERFDALVARGVPCERVLIDIDQFVAWCQQQGIPCDMRARSGYALVLMRQRDSRGGHA